MEVKLFPKSAQTVNNSPMSFRARNARGSMMLDTLIVRAIRVVFPV